MFYLIDKQNGISSFLAIKKFAREKGIKKIGHTGTLDPLATGLLLVATDEDTKLIDYIDKGYKTYFASMKLGFTSDTYDVEGELTEVSKTIPEFQLVKDSLKKMIGFQNQMPPAFSAKKINGKKAYELAREGKEVKLKTSKIEIKDIKNISINKEEISFEVEVSRGTYIRSIIHDLGQELKCGAYMTALRRTKIGTLDESMLGKRVDIFDLLTLKTVKTKDMKDLIDGKKVYTDANDGEYALEYNNDIFGIVIVNDKNMKGKRLFGSKFNKAGI